MLLRWLPHDVTSQLHVKTYILLASILPLHPHIIHGCSHYSFDAMAFALQPIMHAELSCEPTRPASWSPMISANTTLTLFHSYGSVSLSPVRSMTQSIGGAWLIKPSFGFYIRLGL